jgi:type I restriction enzyme S subunit
MRPTEQIDARFFGYFFSTDAYRTEVSSMARGVNINNLKRDHFAAISLPLAPFGEQKRIADKLDAVLARVDACRERLDRVPDILRRFRQSVLAAATSGSLTEDWRDQRG